MREGPEKKPLKKKFHTMSVEVINSGSMQSRKKRKKKKKTRKKLLSSVEENLKTVLLLNNTQTWSRSCGLGIPRHVLFPQERRGHLR
jgi:hypothetical protein